MLTAQAKGLHVMKPIVAQCDADEKGLSTLHHLSQINGIPMNMSRDDFVSQKEKKHIGCHVIVHCIEDLFVVILMHMLWTEESHLVIFQNVLQCPHCKRKMIMEI